MSNVTASRSSNTTISASAMAEEELVALVTWMQTLEGFPHQIISGHSGKVALETVLDDLSTIQCARSIWKVAEEICGSSENNIPNLDNAEDIWTSLFQLSSEHARPLTESSKKPISTNRMKLLVLSNLLDCAVHCVDMDQRRVYVHKIMQLPKTVQKTLMFLIEKRGAGKKSSAKKSSQQSPGTSGSKSRLQAVYNTPERVANDLQNKTPPRSSSATSTITKKPRSILNNSTPTGYSPATAKQRTSPGTLESPGALQNVVMDLQKRNDKMQSSLEKYQQQQKVLEDSLDNIRLEHRKQMMKLETSSMNEMEILRSEHSQQITTLNAELDRYKQLAEEGSQAAKELARARDDVDILQHNRAILKETSEKLQKYKAKVAELQSLKDAYEHEQNAHARCIEELVRLEQEQDGYKAAKRQLDDYKSRAVEAEVRLVECQDYLRRLESKTNDQSAANEHLWKSAVMQQEELEELRRRIQTDTTTAPVVPTGGIGNGISELNPQVMDELTRLRNENLRLRAFASKRENDAVVALENDLVDAKQLVDRFKTQYLTSKEHHAETCVKLDVCNEQIHSLQINVTTIEAEKNDLTNKNRSLTEFLEDAVAQLNGTQHDLDATREQWTATKQEAAMWKSQLCQMENELTQRVELWKQAQTELKDTHRELERTKQLVRELRESVSYWEGRAADVESNETLLKHQLAEKNSELEAQRRTLQEKDESLVDASNRLDDLRGKIDSLNFRMQCMHDENDKLQIQLNDEKRAAQEANEEHNRALEKTRAVLAEQCKTEVEEAIGRMNCLLDDERRTSRRKAEECERTIRELDETWSSEYEALKERCSSTAQSSRQEAQDRIDYLTKKYEDELEKCRQEAKQSHDSLVQKGKGMLNDVKTKATNEYQAMKRICTDLEEQNKLLINESEELKNIIRSKVSEYKKKLGDSVNKINELEQDANDLQDRIETLEKDKVKLAEDNDRYRRQLGGSFGAGGKSQAQLDKLQREYTAILLENRQLKRQARTSGKAPLGSIGEGDADQTGAYRRGGNHGSTFLQQLRQEYEEQIDALNDEKRELVMKNSSAVTDVQKAEQRSWEREQEVARLKAELMTMQLALSRAEYLRNGDELNDCTENKSPRDLSFVTAQEELRSPSAKRTWSLQKSFQYQSAASSTPERPPRAQSRSPSIDRAMKNRAGQEANLRHRISKLSKHPLPPSSRGRETKSMVDGSIESPAPNENRHPLSPTKKHQNDGNIAFASKGLSEPSQEGHDDQTSFDVFGLGTSSSQSTFSTHKQQQQRNLYDVTQSVDPDRQNIDDIPKCQQS